MHSNIPPKKIVQKRRSKMDKLFVGLVVGSAVGSILGVTLAPKSGKETRKIVSKKSGEVWDNITHSKHRGEKSGRGFWHFLHRLFHKKK